MAKKRKVIQIIDDDQDVREYLKTLINSFGHDVIESEDLDSAYVTMTKFVPHMIIIDVNLEEENGFNFIEKIRNFDPYGRIIVFMMSSGNKNLIQKSKQYNVDGFFVKPINNTTLQTTLKKLHPKLGFPTARKIKEKDSLMMAKCLGLVTKMSEVSLVLRSKVKFSHKCKVTINSVILKKLGLERIQLVVQKPSQDVTPGVYDTKVQMIGLKEDNLKQIRKLNTKKA